MTVSFTDKYLRGFAGRINSRRHNYFFSSSIKKDRWGTETGPGGVVTREGMDHPGVAALTVFGAGMTILGIALDPTALAETCANAQKLTQITPEQVLISIYMLGGFFLGIPTVFSALVTSLDFYSLYNKDTFGKSCSCLELLQKFWSIFTAPLLSILTAVTQAAYGAFSLFLACVSLLTCLIPKFNTYIGLGVKTHLRETGAAYLDMVSHVTAALLSFFINAADFLYSAKAKCFGESASEPALAQGPNEVNAQEAFKPFSGKAYRFS